SPKKFHVIACLNYTLPAGLLRSSPTKKFIFAPKTNFFASISPKRIKSFFRRRRSDQRKFSRPAVAPDRVPASAFPNEPSNHPRHCRDSTHIWRRPVCPRPFSSHFAAPNQRPHHP